jgi:hypothetical protein
MGKIKGSYVEKLFIFPFFLLSFAEISLHRIFGTDRFRARSMIISSYNMLTALPARYQLLLIYYIHSVWFYKKRSGYFSTKALFSRFSNFQKTKNNFFTFFLKLLKIWVLFLIKAVLIKQYWVYSQTAWAVACPQPDDKYFITFFEQYLMHWTHFLHYEIETWWFSFSFKRYVFFWICLMLSQYENMTYRMTNIITNIFLNDLMH